MDRLIDWGVNLRVVEGGERRSKSGVRMEGERDRWRENRKESQEETKVVGGGERRRSSKKSSGWRKDIDVCMCVHDVY